MSFSPSSLSKTARSQHPIGAHAARSRTPVQALPRKDGAQAPTLVLIHGLFSSPLEFSLVTRWLRVHGVRFELLEVDGYTRGGAVRSTSEQWVCAAKEALDRRFEPDEPIVLGGLCVGAAIAVALTTIPCRQSIRGLAMLSPTLRIDGWGVSPWRHLRSIPYLFGLDRWISIPERHPFGIKNEKMRRWVARQIEQGDFSSVGPTRLPLWGLKQAERLFAQVRRGLRELDVPLLVVHAREDEIASLEGVRRWMAVLGDGARLVVLDDSYHMVTMDNDRREVVRCLAEFVGAVPPTPNHAPHVEWAGVATREPPPRPRMHLADLTFRSDECVPISQ